MLSEHRIIPKALMVIAILTSGYALTTTKYSLVLYLLCLAGILIFLLELIAYRKKLKTLKLLSALSVLMVFLIPAFAGTLINATEENFISLLKFSLALIFGAVLFLYFEFEKLKKTFSNTVLIVCVVSLPGYLFANFSDLLAPLPVITNVNGVEYKFAAFFISFDGFLQYRNTGVFWEPGIFATMIFAALVADLYSSNKANALRTAVFLIALISTFSGAALILLAAYALLVIFKKNQRGDKNLIGRVVPTVFVSFAACIIGLYLANSQPDAFVYIERLAGKITNPEETQSTRLLSPLISFQVFLDSPIFGLGFIGAIDEYRKLNNEIVLTSTSFYLMSAIGIGAILFTLIPVLSIARLGFLNLPTRSLLIFSFVFIVNKEPHTYFTVTYCLLFFSFLVLISKDLERDRILRSI